MGTPSLQDRFAPASVCYGCGPANPSGLRIASVPDGDDLVADWTPGPDHVAFPGALYGGIIGCLFDCHSNWTAAWALMRSGGLDHPPATVTAEFAVAFKRPTASDRPVRLRARAVSIEGHRVVVEAELESDGEISATCRGTFVAVRPGHPAFHRW